MCNGQNTSSNRRSRAARGAPRRVFEVPGVMTGAVEPRLGIRVQAKFGARAASDEHKAGLLAARHIGSLMIGDKILEQAAAIGRRLTSLKEAKVLDEIGHA